MPRTFATPRISPGRIALALVLAVFLTAAAGGCGSEDSEESGGERSAGGIVDVSGTEPLGEKTAGSVAQLAQCRDWNRGSEPEKLATIADIRSQVNTESPGVEAPPLSNEEALEVFDKACQRPYAQGFRLYILYARAAGVAPLARELSGE